MIFSIVKFALISAVITLCIALGLIASQKPTAFAEDSEGLDFTQQLNADTSEPAQLETVQMRDGYGLPVRRYPNPTKPLLVLVHGSGWHGLQFDGLAKALQADADVIVPDLRGHGEAPQRRGDIDYIGQLEDDLADLIALVQRPDQKVIVAGHSSGGGLVVRFAGGPRGALMDQAILLAPFLKYNAPTTRENSGGWAKVLTRRMIGLSMLNGVGITALNGQEVMQFNMPSAVMDGPLGHTATTAYSYRLNTGYAPRMDYLKDIAALPHFDLIVGAQDEAFIAEGFAPLMSEVTSKGTYHVIDGETHLSIVNADQTRTLMQDILRRP